MYRHLLIAVMGKILRLWLRERGFELGRSENPRLEIPSWLYSINPIRWPALTMNDFSALGGTIGSRIVGELFESIGGASAFYFLLIPMGLLIIFVLLIDRMSKNQEVAQ